MKRLLNCLLLLIGLPLIAADSTINNLPTITTVPDAYVMPWEFPTIADFHITFGNLTNQILAGMASQGYASGVTNPLGSAAWKATSYFDASGAAQSTTNGYPWGVLYDPAGAASGATGALGSAAFKATSFFDVAGAGTTAAQAVTNGYPWGALYDPAGAAQAATNGLASTNWVASFVSLLNQIPGTTNYTDGNGTIIWAFTNGVQIATVSTNGNRYGSGNYTNAGLIKALRFIGSGSNLTDLPGGSATSLVTNIWTTNTTGQVPGSSISGTLTNNTTGTASIATTAGSATNPAVGGNLPGLSWTNMWTGIEIFTNTIFNGTVSNRGIVYFGSTGQGNIAIDGTFNFASSANFGAVSIPNGHAYTWTGNGDLYMYSAAGWTAGMLYASGNGDGSAKGITFSGNSTAPSSIHPAIFATTNVTPRLTIVSGNATGACDLVVSGSGTFTNGVVLPLTATPPSLSVNGCQLWSDGTNLCVILRNSSGTLTTNKATLSTWP